MSNRSDRLAALGYASYNAYLRSNAWREVKRRYRASKLPQRCRVCGAAEVDLHHRSYKRIGAERLHDLVPLCRLHHDEVHKHLRNFKRRDLWKQTRRYVKKQRKVIR